MFKKKQLPSRKTLPGSTTSVFSYYSSRSSSETARARYEPLNSGKGFARLKHLPVVLALLVIVSTLVYASFLTVKPRVIIASTSNGKSLERSSDIYERHIAQELQKTPLNRSKLTFDAQPLTLSLRSQFPEVGGVAVTLPIIGQRPVVHIAVSSPAFILASTNGAYYMNNEGVALIRVADVKTPLDNLTTVSDTSGVPVTVGQQALPRKTVVFISSVIANMHALNAPIESLELSGEAHELKMQLPGKGYYVRLSSLRDARVQVGTLRAVENRLQSEKVLPEEYIDVRVEERAFYR